MKQIKNQVENAERQDFDVIHYELNLDVLPLSKMIDGSATVIVKSNIDGLTAIAFDLHGNVAVTSVEKDGLALNFTHSAGKLHIELNKAVNFDSEFGLNIVYQAPMVASLPEGQFVIDYHMGQPIISNFSGASYWFPCNDIPSDKATAALNVTVPKDLVVASNGVLVDTIELAGKTTYKWRENYPISTYLMSVAISNYSIVRDYYVTTTGDSMEIVYYVYPEHVNEVDEKFRITVNMIEFFSSVFGEYPFIDEKYGMAEFPFGVVGMEHQTITSIGEGVLPSPLDKDWIVAHELAHQWWGDYVTLADWPYLWLNEGFASYAEALWSEHVNGSQAYREYMQAFENDIQPGTLYDPQNPWSTLAYDKGAWVLHMLRHVVGEQDFGRILPSYAQQLAFANATTEDFLVVCENVSNTNLEWFFQQWVYGHDRPRYGYSWYDSVASDGNIAILTLRQQQTGGLFKMPIDVEITTISGKSKFVAWDSLEVQRFDFTLPEQATGITLDPDDWILKHVEYQPTHVENRHPPAVFAISQNYPNPFNAETVIRYEIAGQGMVVLDIYNVLGRHVRRFVEGSKPPGNYSVIWDGRDDNGYLLASGVYCYMLKMDDTVLPFQKMLMLK